MPRPQKYRKVCCLPKCSEFIPATDNGIDEIILTVDEYETIRLIDSMDMSQEECCNYMHVARTTVQQIYTQARKKIADALVNGKAIKIEGGNYKLCDGDSHYCGCNSCLLKKNDKVL